MLPTNYSSRCIIARCRLLSSVARKEVAEEEEEG